MTDSRVLDKLDRLDDKTDELVVTQVEIQRDLKEHMRRTEANEKMIQAMHSDVHRLKIEAEVRAEVRESWRRLGRAVAKFLMWLVGVGISLASLAWAVYKYTGE